MKTASELTAIAFQRSARFTHCVARAHMQNGAVRYAKEDQQRAAHDYRMARAYMGITNGDVKKAQQ